MPFPQAYILQDPTKALILQATLDNGASPVPNGTVTFRSGNDSSVLATVNVTNPNGTETRLTAYAFCDLALSDSVGSVWWNTFVTASYSVGGVGISANPSIFSLIDSYDGTDGAWSSFLDPDGHSVWVLPDTFNNCGAIQKYDLNTRALTATWGFPFNGTNTSNGNVQMRGYYDGTGVFIQDNAGNIYVMSYVLNGSNGPANVVNRIHKINPTTFAEIAAFGYDDVHPVPGWVFGDTNLPVNTVFTPTDYALYTRGGHDYLAVSCDLNASIGSGVMQILDLTALTVYGYFNPGTDLGTSLVNHSVWVDKFGVVWWACSDGGATGNLYLVTWNPASGTSGLDAPPNPQQPKLNGVAITWTIPQANWQSSVGGNEAFCYYQASNHTIVYSNFAAGANGNGGDLGIIDLATGNVTHFLQGATSDPPPAYGGSNDVVISCMKVVKGSPWSTNTNLMVETPPISTFTPPQDGGFVNIVDPTTLTTLNRYNLTQIAETTVGGGSGYTDQGLWSNAVNYSPKDLVTGSDGFRYVCKIFTGPTAVDSGPLDPAARSSNRPVNSYEWSGIPVETQHINNLIGNPPLAFPPHGTVLYVQSLNAVVFAHEFSGSPAMLIQLAAPAPPPTSSGFAQGFLFGF
jgi:hypothetical protein